MKKLEEFTARDILGHVRTGIISQIITDLDRQVCDYKKFLSEENDLEPEEEDVNKKPLEHYLELLRAAIEFGYNYICVKDEMDKIIEKHNLTIDKTEK